MSGYATRCLAADGTGIAEAARLLKEGLPVGMPTETVYGLAANAFNPKAIKKIFAAKGRPQDNPLIVHISSLSMLSQAARDIPDAAYILAKAFWPGPLTLVLARSPALAKEVGPGLSTVGVRLPAHPAARALIRAAAFPLAAPSANRSGAPSPTAAAHVMADLAGRIPLVLDGGPCPLGVESTVVTLTGKTPCVLRPGFVTAGELAAALGAPVQTARGLEAPLEDGVIPQSPGLKYTHYAPNTALTLVSGSLSAFAAFLLEKRGGAGGGENRRAAVAAMCFTEDLAQIPAPALAYGSENSAASQAAGLFAALRALDGLCAKEAYARMPKDGGVGMAVKNRLLRAAAFRVIDLDG